MFDRIADRFQRLFSSSSDKAAKNCKDEERRIKSYNVGLRLIDLVDLMFWFVIFCDAFCLITLSNVAEAYISLRPDISTLVLIMYPFHGIHLRFSINSWEAFHHFL